MEFYKLKLYGIPKIAFTSTFSSNGFCHRFPGGENLLEITVIDSGGLTKQSRSRTEDFGAKSISYIFSDFKGTTMPKAKEPHRHTTVGMRLAYDYERCRAADYTRAQMVALKRETAGGAAALLPARFSSEKQYQHTRHMISQITRHYTLRQAADGLAITGLWFQLLSYLTEICVKQLLQSENFGVTPAALLYSEKAIHYINANLHRRFQVAEVAARLSITPNYLQAVFRQVTDCSVMDYTNRLRVELAKDYFAQHGATAAEAAELFGFADAGYFSRLFHRLSGMSIQAYKLSLTGKE